MEARGEMEDPVDRLVGPRADAIGHEIEVGLARPRLDERSVDRHRASVAGERPARQRKSVVFPEPFGPMSPRISFGRMENLAPRRAQNRPKRFERSSTR